MRMNMSEERYSIGSLWIDKNFNNETDPEERRAYYDFFSRCCIIILGRESDALVRVLEDDQVTSLDILGDLEVFYEKV